MMTVHKLSAGDGYAYYVREVASADELRAADRKLGDYYHVSGNPPGQWGGSAAHLLGVDGEVDEEQMELLYGQGLHPRSGQVDPATGKTIDSRLGQRYKRIEQDDGDFSARVSESLAAFQRLNHREPDADERRTIRAKVGGELFREIHGRNAKSKEELGQFMSAQGRPKGNAVAGYDLVFSPPKSVSYLWGVGGYEAREAIERAQYDAVRDAMEFIEENATYTRRGKNGVRTEEVQDGVIYSRFRHYDSRTGDPQLHDHVVVSNKVLGADGKWSSLDGRPLYQYAVAASEVYNRAVIERVSDYLGVAPVMREVPGKRPIMEIGGVDMEAIEASSSRRASINESLDKLVDEFVEDHGYQPTQKQLIALSQQATLESRPDKKHGRPLSELVDEWQQKFSQIPGAAVGKQAVEKAREFARNRTDQDSDGTITLDEEQIRKAAGEVIETVSDQRAVWSESHVIAESRRHLGRMAGAGHVPEETYDAVVRAALDDHSLTVSPAPVTPAVVAGAFENVEQYRRPGSALYTNERVLVNEDSIVRAAEHPVIPAASHEAFDETLDELRQTPQGAKLNDAQVRLAREFATGDRLVVGGIGPAGAGKSTAMQLAAETIKSSGGRVVAVAPTAAAASLLGDDIETESMTIDRLVRTGNEPSAQFVPLKAGDVIIVDEAGMVGTPMLSDLISLAEQSGAHVRLLGDDRQLSAVGAGGALRLLDREIGLTRLEEVHRFRTVDGEVNDAEAAASLALREPPAVGTDKPWDYYFQQDRVIGGDVETMQDEVFRAWQLDVDAGRDSLMMAPTNELVGELNSRAQTYRIAAGELDPEEYLPLRDGARVHVGDTIVTRKNDRRIGVHGGRDFVKNGDAWTVLGMDDDGSITVRHAEHSGTATLPAAFVAAQVDLGYASTVHRAQGRTVDTAHAVISDQMDRAAAYVATSRGRYDNRIYVPVAEGETPADVLDTVASRHEAPAAAHEAVDVERDRARSLDQLGSVYRDLAEMAEAERYKGMAYRVLDHGDAETLTSCAAWGAVATKLRQGEDSGVAADVLLRDAVAQREIDTAEEPAAVVAWRIDPMLESYQLQTEREARPLSNVPDAHLRDLQARAQQSYADIVAESRDLVEAEAIEAGVTPFNQRTYWHLSHERLDERITEAQDALDRQIPSDPQNDSARLQWEIDGLTEERTLRQQMPQPLNEAETLLRDRAQRKESAATVLERIDDEISIRRISHQPVEPDPQNQMGEWFAPTTVLRDPDTPQPWVDQLSAYRQTLASEFDRVGAKLAEEPPAWTEAMGPVPARADRARQWRELAAEVAAYRATYKVPDSEPALVPEEHAEHPAAEDFVRRATELHKHSALTSRPPETTEERQQQRAAAEDAARLNVEPAEAETVVGELRRERQAQQADEEQNQQLATHERLRRILAERRGEEPDEPDEQPEAPKTLSERLAALRRDNEGAIHTDDDAGPRRRGPHL